MSDISSTFKSVLKQKYSSIQDTSVNHGNAQISADHNVENIDLSLTSSTSDNKVAIDSKISDLSSGKESFVSFQDLSKKELANIDSIINKADNLISRYELLSFQAKDGYGAAMQYAQGELKQAEIDLDNFIKANSSYDSYQDLLNTQKELEDIDKSCTEMISYYDRQIKWQEYYKKYDSEECRNFSIEGMLGEKEYHDNISGSTFRGEEYTKLLEIQTIGNYDEKLKELFGDDYEKQFASYGLDFKFDYLKMYNYIYQTEGEAAAKEFYAFAEDNINSMAGLVGALSAVKDLKTNAEIMDAATNYLQVHAEGLGDGVVGSLEGVVAWFSNNKSRSASSYETMWYSMMLETGKYGKGQIFNYQVGQGTGQMLPVMLIGCVCPESLTIGGLPVVKAATSGYLLMSSGGRDYKEQMINGKTREEAIIHGLLAGTTEVTTEHLLGGLPFLSDSNVYNLRTFFTAMGKEGTQEVIQDMISEFLLGEGIPTFNSEAERDAYWEQWSKEKLMTFAVAAFSAGELQGGSLAMSTSNINYINKQIKLGTVTEQELVDLIKKQYPLETMDLSNQQILGEYNGQISKYVELKLEALLHMTPEASSTTTEEETPIITSSMNASIESLDEALERLYKRSSPILSAKEALDIIKQEGTNYSNPSIDQQLQSKRFVMELILQSKQDNYSGIELIKDKCPILSEAIMDYIIETNAINGIENLLTLIDTDKYTEEFVIHLFKYVDLYKDFNIILGYVPKELANECIKKMLLGQYRSNSDLLEYLSVDSIDEAFLNSLFESCNDPMEMTQFIRHLPTDPNIMKTVKEYILTHEINNNNVSLFSYLSDQFYDKEFFDYIEKNGKNYCAKIFSVLPDSLYTNGTIPVSFFQIAIEQQKWISSEMFETIDAYPEDVFNDSFVDSLFLYCGWSILPLIEILDKKNIDYSSRLKERIIANSEFGMVSSLPPSGFDKDFVKLLLQKANYDQVVPYIPRQFFTKELFDELHISPANWLYGLINPPAPKEVIEKIVQSNDTIKSNEQTFITKQLNRLVSKGLFSSIEEANLAVNQLLKSIFTESEFGRRTSEKTIEACLDSGYIVSQFDSGGKSGGCKQLSVRVDTEYRMGVPLNAAFSDRPIYGMLFPSGADKEAQKLFITKSSGLNYGVGSKNKCVIIFNKEAILSTTTFSIGDSLDYTPESGISSTSNPQFKGGFKRFIDLLINNNGSATLEQISSVASDTYMEIQIHGKESHKMDSEHIR